MDFDYKIISAVIGLLSGFLGSTLKPLISWDLEKRKLRRQDRIAKIKFWRSQVDAHTDFETFLDTATFNELRSRFTKKQLENFSAKWTSQYGCETKPWERGKFLEVHTVIDKIEKEWRVI